LNISFRTAPTLEVSDLERPLRAGEGGVYSYAEKYLAGQASEQAGLASAPREIPAQVPEAVTEQAEGLARKVAAVTRLTGVVRVDLLYDEASHDLFVNEVNSVPGA